MRKYYDVSVVRQHDGRLERAAALSRVVGRLGARCGRSTSTATSRTCSSGSATRSTPTTGAMARSDARWSASRCPAFLIGGWRDGYPNPPLRLFSRLQCPKKVLIGPWDHRPPDVAVPGPRIDHLHEVVRWLDHWCKGADERRHGRAARRRLHAGGRAAGRRPPGLRGRLARRDGVAGARRVGARAASRVRAARSAAQAGRRRRRRATLRPDGRRRPAGLWSGGIQFGLPGDQRPDEALSLTTPRRRWRRTSTCSAGRAPSCTWRRRRA